ncbi:hypothetical protein Tco_1499170, partial [Tanacetum coccineum]
MSKLLYTHFIKLIIDYFLSCNKNIPRRSDSEMHNEGDDSPITKLPNTVKGTYMFRMEIPNTMINDAFKKSARYKYYKVKKAESEKEKAAEEPEVQNKSPVISGRGKGYMRLGDYEANVPKMFKKDVVPRKTRSLTVAKERVAVELAKSISIQEQRTQKRRRNTSEESANETDDADNSDMDLTDDEPKGDDDTASNPVYTDAHTTSAVHNLEGNPEVRSFLSGASEVPFGQSKEADAKGKEEYKEDQLQEGNTLYESITLDHEALNAQDAKPSFYNRTHNDQYPLNDREGEKRKKIRKDVGQS